MAAAGGHWIKGSFQPAGGAVGSREDVEQGFVKNPESMSELESIMAKHGNPYGEYAFFYDPKTGDLAIALEGYHDDLEAALGNPPGWMDTQVHGVLKGMPAFNDETGKAVKGKGPSLFFRTTGAGHYPRPDRASATYDPSDRDVDRQWRNIYKAARKMGSIGLKDSVEVVVDEWIPPSQRSGQAGYFTGSRIVRTSVGASS